MRSLELALIQDDWHHNKKQLENRHTVERPNEDTWRRPCTTNPRRNASEETNLADNLTSDPRSFQNFETINFVI